jgi:hypothetical protein
MSTAATMAALRRSRRFAQVLLRIEVKLLFALGTAEVIGLPLVLSLSSGGGRLYVHAAHRIFHSCCAIHYDLSVVRKFVQMLISRPSATHHAPPEDSDGLANGPDQNLLTPDMT